VHRIRALPAPLAVLIAIALLVAACGASTTPVPASEAPGPTDLAASLPDEVDGVAMEKRSISAADVEADPAYADLMARLNNANLLPSDAQLAEAVPADGATELRIVALRLAGTQGQLSLVVNEWAGGLPDPTVTNTNVGGKPVVQVEDASLEAGTVYAYIPIARPDTLYVVQSPDPDLAAAALEGIG
jgi:hypothetical protein